MERVKILESSTEESLGIEEAVCMKSVVRNWRDPTHRRKVKKKAYKLGEVVFSDGRESERNIVPIMTVQDNAVYGYGFRPKRSAKQALEVVRKACNNKGYYVVDADIEKFFDNVNQDKLMALIELRISDRRIQKLIRQWLKSGILYGDILEISELGTSQGSVISPLLANIYLNTLDRLWEKYGLTHGILVRYADDTVIICKKDNVAFPFGQSVKGFGKQFIFDEYIKAGHLKTEIIAFVFVRCEKLREFAFAQIRKSNFACCAFRKSAAVAFRFADQSFLC